MAITEPNKLGDAVRWEEENFYSRKQVTIASGEDLSLCQVVGKVTASGEYAAFDQDAEDGTETAAGILIAAVDASTAAAQGVIIESDAMVVVDNLVWPSDITAGEKAIAVASLEALGIKAVTEV